ncbi:MAG: serine acetyltransferase, partial [Deltaproteobacteria bacterium]|nr:serine acetyltransferase [Deltaproteobacteria bacterium]
MAEERARTLSEVVDSLCDASNDANGPIMRSGRRQELPSRGDVLRVVEDLRSVLFPGYFGTSEMSAESMRFHVGSTLDRVLSDLGHQIKRGMCFYCEQEDPARCPDCEARALSKTEQFLDRLPGIRSLLATDVRAAFEGDPAATSKDEAIFCYPGLVAITNY